MLFRSHNHPLEKHTQDDFHRFAAFFSRVHLERREPAKGATELVTQSKERVERGRRLAEAASALAEVQGKVLDATGDARTAAARDMEERRKEHARLKREVEEMDARPPRTMQPRTREEVEARPLDRTAMRWRPGGDAREELVEWLVSTNNQIGRAHV